MSYVSNFEVIIISLFVAIAAAVLFFKYKFRYWKVRGVPRVEEPAIPWGINISLYKTYIGEHFKTHYEKAKQRGYKHAELFLCCRPIYFALDPEYIKNVLQRDFDCFAERGFYCNEKGDPLGANLVAIEGEKWRMLRKHLSPAFTPGKLKLLFDDMLRCAQQMADAVEQSRRDKQSVNIQDIFERYTSDVIGSCVFGLQCDSFKNPHSEFRKQGREIFHFTAWRILKVFAAFSLPNLSKRLGIRLFDDGTTSFFINLVRGLMTHRNGGAKARKDFLQLLLELQDDNKKTKARALSVEELTAQAFIFFAAGFETSSITLTFCLYELAINRDVQDKLRKEIQMVVRENGGKVTYDAIMDMKYMNQVVEETLRKYPPVPFMARVCTKDYTMPGTTTVIEEGIQVLISILGLHRDPDYYPDPDKFDPERFSNENRERLQQFTYLPFGEGPRICIGMRFGLLQVKAGLALLLKEHEFTLVERSKAPLELKSFSFAMKPKRSIFVDVTIAD